MPCALCIHAMSIFACAHLLPITRLKLLLHREMLAQKQSLRLAFRGRMLKGRKRAVSRCDGKALVVRRLYVSHKPDGCHVPVSIRYVRCMYVPSNVKILTKSADIGITS